MKISTRGRYGLRAMVDLAIYSANEPVSIHSIAERQQISDSYLEQLIGKLKRAGLVSSVRGATGGYQLAKKPEEISAGDILRVLEGDLMSVTCGNDEEAECCEASDYCVTRYVWHKVHEGIISAVDHLTLAELSEQSKGFHGGC
jgi:Rrf2 family protein